MPGFNEIDAVEILVDRPAKGLRAGDAGTVVLVYGHGEAVEVEFMRDGGETWILETFLADEVRVASSNALPNATQAVAAPRDQPTQPERRRPMRILRGSAVMLTPIAAVMVLGAATCQSRAPSAQPPQTPSAPPSADATAQEGVAGAWLHREMPVRYLETMDLAVAGEHVTGTGTYMMEGGRAGKTAITGTWRGGTLTLDLTRENGGKEHYAGRLEGGKLTGQLTIDGDTQPFGFERPQP